MSSDDIESQPYYSKETINDKIKRYYDNLSDKEKEERRCCYCKRHNIKPTNSIDKCIGCVRYNESFCHHIEMCHCNCYTICNNWKYADRDNITKLYEELRKESY